MLVTAVFGGGWWLMRSIEAVKVPGVATDAPIEPPPPSIEIYCSWINDWFAYTDFRAAGL